MRTEISRKTKKEKDCLRRYNKVLFIVQSMAPNKSIKQTIYYQRKFGRNFRVTDSREEMRLESEINQMMSIRK